MQTAVAIAAIVSACAAMLSVGLGVRAARQSLRELRRERLAIALPALRRLAATTQAAAMFPESFNGIIDDEDIGRLSALELDSDPEVRRLADGLAMKSGEFAAAVSRGMLTARRDPGAADSADLMRLRTDVLGPQADAIKTDVIALEAEMHRSIGLAGPFVFPRRRASTDS